MPLHLERRSSSIKKRHEKGEQDLRKCAWKGKKAAASRRRKERAHRDLTGKRDEKRGKYFREAISKFLRLKKKSVKKKKIGSLEVIVCSSSVCKSAEKGGEEKVVQTGRNLLRRKGMIP